VGFERTLPDGQLALDPSSFEEAKTVVSLAAPLAGRLGRVTEVHFSPSAGYRMVFADGVDVLIGSNEFEERFRRIDQTLDALDARGEQPRSLVVGGLDMDRVAVRFDDEVAR
jgi:hypothetical protein